MAAATQLKGAVLPIGAAAPAVTFVPLSEVDASAAAYKALRQERTNARLVGIRAKKAKEAAEKAAKEGAKADAE